MGQDYEAMQAYIDQASDINGQLILLIVISIILGLGKGGVPGFATVATALTVATAPLKVKGGLGYAVSLQVPILAMIDISAAYLHSTSIDWQTTWLLLPLSFIGMGIGQILDKFMTDALARILVGFILLAILVLKVWKDVANFMFSESPPPLDKSDYDIVDNSDGDHEYALTNRKKYIWACIVGFFGGAATMLTNSMGPILNVYLLSVRKQSPTEYVGTRAMFFCFLNVGKLPMRFMSGALGWSMIPLAFGLGLISVLGVFCAKPIMLSMKEETFVKLELIVVAFAGLRLMWLGFTM